MNTYTRFSDTSFALYDGHAPDGTGKWDAPTFRLSSGGGFDALGSERGRRGDYDLTLSGDLVGTSISDVATQLRALKALARTKGRLYRTALDTGEETWADARLLYIDDVIEGDTSLILTVSVAFTVLSPCWYGQHHSGSTLLWGTVINGGSGIKWGSGRTWNEASGDVFSLSALSGTPQNVVLVNEGNLPVSAVTFSIKAGNAAITSVHIVGNGTDLTWTGTLAAGKTLIIDGATDTVTNDGALAINNTAGVLTWNNGHTKDDLFELVALGSTTYAITGSGGGTGVQAIVEYDAANA
jgi:hypothetical protein